MKNIREDTRFYAVSYSLKSVVFCLTLLLSFVVMLSSVASSHAFAQEAPDLDLSALEQDDTPSSPTADDSADAETTAATTESSPSSPASSGNHTKFMDLVVASGWIGIVLLGASIVAVTLIIRFCFMLRRSVFQPADLLESSADALARGNIQRAYELSSSSDSFLGVVLASGLREADRGWNAVEKAIEDAVSERSARLYRHTEPLSVIGNVAPMLGLLGTVMGMVSTFGELAVADGSGRNLANGIYFALVTTVMGLLVAIPVLVAHSLLNTRVASLVSDATNAIDRLLEPIKHGGAVGRVETKSESVPGSTRPAAAEKEIRRPVRGLKEITPPPEKPSDAGLEGLRQRPSARPSLSLKNRRQEEEDD